MLRPRFELGLLPVWQPIFHNTTFRQGCPQPFSSMLIVCMLENGWGSRAETLYFEKLATGVVRTKSHGYPTRAHPETRLVIFYFKLFSSAL